MVLEVNPDLNEKEAADLAEKEAPEGFQFHNLLRLASGKEVRFYVPIKDKDEGQAKD